MNLDKRLRSMDNQRKYAFDEAVLLYDKMRPTYVKPLFDDVIAFSQLGEGKRAIEMGVGTGQATLPFLQTGASITAVELGESLAQFTREKFAAYPNCEVINQDFESVALEENACDLFYCASAFHWVPQEIGYPKVYRLLRHGGTMALFFNRPFPVSQTDPTHLALQAVYDKYWGKPEKPRPHQFVEADCAEILEQIARYGFVDAQCKLYHATRTFSAEAYVMLTGTYSDHIAMPKAKREAFNQELMDAIDGSGGTCTLHDTIDLYLARRP